MVIAADGIQDPGLNGVADETALCQHASHRMRFGRRDSVQNVALLTNEIFLPLFGVGRAAALPGLRARFGMSVESWNQFVHARFLGQHY